jgi:titin
LLIVYLYISLQLHLIYHNLIMIKRNLLTLLVISLLLPLMTTPSANAAPIVKITSAKQSGKDIIVTWKYLGVKKVVSQNISVRNELMDFEKNFKLSSSSVRSFRIVDQELNSNYIVTVNETKLKITTSKKVFLYEKPTAPKNLTVQWLKDTLLMDWEYNGPIVKEWLITATGSDGKEYLSTSTNSSANSYKLNGLSSSMGYTIIIRGSNNAGVGKFTNANATKSAPAQPKDLKIQPISDDGRSIMLSWDYSGPVVSKWLVGIRASGYSRDLETLSLSGKNKNVEIRGLSESGLYKFILVGVNEYGNSAEGSSVYTANQPIKAPTNLKATSLNQSIRLQWSAPFSDSKAPITGYRIEYAPITASKYLILSSSTPETFYTITGLKNGEQYKFRVSAISQTSLGMLSPDLTTTAGIIPGLPTSLKAVSGDLKVDLTWVAPKGNILSYSVEYRISSETIWNRVEVSGDTKLTIPDLIGGATYNFRVAAESESGLGQFTTAISATPISPPGAPVLSFTMGNRSVSLSWSVPVENGSKITGYRVFTREGNGVFVPLQAEPILTNKILVTSLKAGETYHYQVLAINAVGDGNLSNLVSTNISTTSEIPVLTAVGGNKTVTLSWEAPISNGSNITAYRVERSGNGSNWAILSETIASNSFTDTNLVNGSKYEYRLSAKNATGWSSPSLAVKGEPVGNASAVSNVTVVPFIEELSVSWSGLGTSNVYTGGSAVLGYKVYMKTPSSSWSIAPGGVLGSIPSSIPTPSPSASPSASPAPSSAPSSSTPSSTAVATNLLVSDLQPGVTYSFKIVAFSLAGDGAESEIRSGTPYGAPGAPVDLSAIGGEKKVSLTWIAPERPIHAPITAKFVYKVEYSLDDTNWLPISVVPTLAAELTNIINGYPYKFRVTTGYTVGTRTAFGESAIAYSTPRGAPSAPSGFRATRIDSSNVRLEWSSPTYNGGASISGYEIQYSDTGKSWTTPPGDQPNAGVNSKVIGSMTTDKPWIFRIRSLNSLTCTNTAAIEAQIILEAALVKMAAAVPARFTLIDQDFSGADFDLSQEGTQNSGTVRAFEAGAFYWLYRSKENIEVKIRDNGTLDASFSNNCRSTYVTTQVAGLPTPSPLTGLQVASVNNGSISLKWTANPSSDVVIRYRAEYSTNNTNWIAYPAQITTDSVTIDQLTNNTLYYFRVSAQNSSGLGLSSVTTATPVGPSPISNFSATSGDSLVRLAWSLPSNPAAIISNVLVEYSSDNGVTFATHGLLPANSSSTVVESLTNSLPYQFRVTLLTNLGNSLPVLAVATPQPILPSQVRNLSANVTGTSALITWSTPLNTGLGQITYRVEYKKFDSATWVLAVADNLTTNYTLNSLDNSWTYNLRVTAINSSGAGPTAVVNVTT